MTKAELLREEHAFREAEKAKRLEKAVKFAKNNPEIWLSEVARRFNVSKDKLIGACT